MQWKSRRHCSPSKLTRQGALAGPDYRAGSAGPWFKRLFPPLRWNLRFRLGCAVVLARAVCRIFGDFDFREPLHARCVDLGDGVLERNALDLFRAQDPGKKARLARCPLGDK